MLSLIFSIIFDLTHFFWWHLESLVFTSYFPVHVSMTVKVPPLLAAYWSIALTAGILKREDSVISSGMQNTLL